MSAERNDVRELKRDRCHLSEQMGLNEQEQDDE